MLIPTYQALRKLNCSASYATPLHPSPALFKYLWRVFTHDSPIEGHEFWDHGPQLCTFACFEWLERLDAGDIPYLLYNSRRRRQFTGMPFDPSSERWINAEWAPALEDDSDPAWNGHR